MLLIKYFCLRIISSMIFMMFAGGVSAKVLELEESQLHGKKDQPEAITFISRAQLDISSKPVEINFKKRIKREIDNNKIFDEMYVEH